ncbi:hypothetical protein [Bacteroides sedimenti]|uniref:Uncharacterized protein n=1 Tax=Bacteroides sedimenti TaxID=2136147 RepID=A0ABN6Z2R2_9BACE
MRKIILVTLLLISVKAYTQETKQVNGVTERGFSKKELTDSISIMLTENSKEILHRSGGYLQRSGYYEYGAIGTLAASTACFFIGFNNFNIFDEENTHSINAACMIAGTLLFATAVVCTIKSIKYNKKAGKELRLFVKDGSGTVMLIF